MVPPCHSLGVANSRVVSVCGPNSTIFSLIPLKMLVLQNGVGGDEGFGLQIHLN